MKRRPDPLPRTRHHSKPHRVAAKKARRRWGWRLRFRIFFAGSVALAVAFLSYDFAALLGPGETPEARPAKQGPEVTPAATGKASHSASAGPSASEPSQGAEPPLVYNSPWNGSVWQVERYLKRSLYDASSFQAVAWGPVTGTKKGYRVRCTYQSRNVLGVYATQTKTFLLNRKGEVYAVTD